ncbi:MAG: metallophosphoesterase, partial [Clostridia bacterium]|nr:metallophosphoesterase [Clostridia bacterium]
MGLEDKFTGVNQKDEKGAPSAENQTHESGSGSPSGSESHPHESGGHRSGSSSSRHRKRKSSQNGSLLKRIQHLFDKTFGRKSRLMLNLTAILLTAVLLCGLFFSGVIIRNAMAPQEETGEISDSTYEPSYQTSSDGLTVPSYWKSMITEKTEVVKALQAAGGKDCVSFAWASDTHIPDNHTGKTDHLGKVMAQMLDNCEIPFAVLSGDIGTRSSCSTEAELVESQKQIAKHLSPLWGTERLLVALGNHDGTWGNNPNGDGVTGYYRYQSTPEQLWETYFRWQSLDFSRVFSEDGLYFYVDNIAQKTRFIVLNSQYGGEYSEDVYGWAINDRFGTSCYGQAQLDWLADVALDMPAGYSAVITTHVPPKLVNGATTPYTVDCDQLNGIINAYCNKTTFSGSYTAGVDGWSNSTVDVDFTDAKGEIIALFAGHIHQDTVDTTTLACPIITIISAGASVNAGESPERTPGTDTETSFDV